MKGGKGLTKGDEGKVGGGVDSSGGGRVWKGLLGLRWRERWKIEGEAEAEAGEEREGIDRRAKKQV